MSEASRAREDICRIAKSMFDRGLTCGASGNISYRLSDGSYLVTPTGSSMGFLDPARISHLDADMRHLSGDKSRCTAPFTTRAPTRALWCIYIPAIPLPCRCCPKPIPTMRCRP
jgi:ribulose-5-phosphate 4-epimerase/fuculose-1-phosphate aldolase